MRLIKPNLPAEVLEYKDRHVWPPKSKLDGLIKRGSLLQRGVRTQLISALDAYICFLRNYEGEQVETEMAWAANELSSQINIHDGNLIRVGVREAGRHIAKDET